MTPKMASPYVIRDSLVEQGLCSYEAVLIARTLTPLIVDSFRSDTDYEKSFLFLLVDPYLGRL